METKSETIKLAELMNEGHAVTLNTLRKIIRMGLDVNLMLLAIVAVIEPRAAMLLTEAIQAEAATGEPLPERRAMKRVSPIEHIKRLLLADLPPETAMLLIADVVMPGETAAVVAGSFVDGVWVPEALLAEAEPVSGVVANA